MRNIPIKVAPSLDLRTSKKGGSLTVREVRLELRGHEQGPPLAAHLHFLLSPADWRVVDRSHLFHLEPEARGPIFAGGFEPSVDIEIEARLSAEVLDEIRPQDVFLLAGEMVDDAHDGRLRETESWWALNVKQKRGQVKTGFQTRWA